MMFCTGLTLRGFLKEPALHVQRMRYRWCKFGLDQSTTNSSLLEEQRAFSAYPAFRWINFHATSHLALSTHAHQTL